MRASLNTAGDQEMSGGKGLGKEDVAIWPLSIGVLIVISTKCQRHASINTFSTQAAFPSNKETVTPSAQTPKLTHFLLHS